MTATAPGGAPPANPSPAALPRVLIAHPDPAQLRLLRETLEAFLLCEVDTTTAAVTAFERMIRHPHRLVLLDLHLDVLPGELLYDLVARAWPRCHPGLHTAPPVIWLGNAADFTGHDHLTRDVRCMGTLTMPPNLQRLLSLAGSQLAQKP